MINITRNPYTAFTRAFRIPVTSLFALTIWFLLPLPAMAQPNLDTQTIRFVADVLCGTEFGENGEKLCSRWAKAPTLSTFGSGSHHPTVVANVINQINGCLPVQLQIKLLDPNDTAADIKIYFVPLKDFGSVAKENGFEYISNNLGFFEVRWNGNYEIVRANVLIADDKLRGRRLHHFLLEEVTQSLGLAGDSKRFRDSIFYEDPSKNEFGNATQFSELDRKLIRFLYANVEPGTQPVELGVQLARHWR